MTTTTKLRGLKGIAEFIILSIVVSAGKTPVTAKTLRAKYKKITGTTLTAGPCFTTLNRFIDKGYMSRERQPHRSSGNSRPLLEYSATKKGRSVLKKTTKSLEKVILQKKAT